MSDCSPAKFWDTCRNVKFHGNISTERDSLVVEFGAIGPFPGLVLVLLPPEAEPMDKFAFTAQ